MKRKSKVLNPTTTKPNPKQSAKYPIWENLQDPSLIKLVRGLTAEQGSRLADKYERRCNELRAAVTGKSEAIRVVVADIDVAEALFGLSLQSISEFAAVYGRWAKQIRSVLQGPAPAHVYHTITSDSNACSLIFDALSSTSVGRFNLANTYKKAAEILAFSEEEEFKNKSDASRFRSARCAMRKSKLLENLGYCKDARDAFAIIQNLNAVHA
jgi:hypothetical protein